MDIDMPNDRKTYRRETNGGNSKSGEQDDSRLNAVVAITVAVLATFLGICKVTDDNIVQAMQKAQTEQLNAWNYYQARNLRQEIAESTTAQLELARAIAPAAAASAYDVAITKYKTLAVDQNTKKELLKKQAEQAQASYDALNYRDDQFDLSDALLAIAIAMMAVTALTQLWALYWVSLLPTGFGLLMGLAGLCGWQIQFTSLVKLLT